LGGKAEPLSITTTTTTTTPLTTTIKTDPKAWEKFVTNIQQSMQEKEMQKTQAKVFPISTKVEGFIENKTSELPEVVKLASGFGKEFFGSVAQMAESPITLYETFKGTAKIAKEQGIKQTALDYGTAFSVMPESMLTYAYENPLEFAGRIGGGILLGKVITKVTAPKYIESLELENIYQMPNNKAVIKGKVISKAKPLIGKTIDLGTTDFKTAVKSKPIEGLKDFTKSKSFSEIITDIKGKKTTTIGEGISISSTKGKLTGSIGKMDVFDITKKQIETISSESLTKNIGKGKYFTIGGSITDKGTKGVSIGFSQVINKKGYGGGYGDLFTEIVDVAKKQTEPVITSTKIMKPITFPKTTTPIKTEIKITEKSPLSGMTVKVPEIKSTKDVSQLEKYTPLPVKSKPISIQIIESPKVMKEEPTGYDIKFPDETQKPASEKLKYPSPWSPSKKIIEEEEYYIRPPSSPAIQIPASQMESVLDIHYDIQPMIGQITIPTSQTFTREIPSIAQVTSVTEKTRQREIPMTRQIEIQKPVTRQIQMQQPIQKRITRQIYLQKPMTQTRQRPMMMQMQQQFNKTNLIVPPPMISTKLGKKYKSIGTGKAYSILVRKGGKFIKIKSPPLTRQSALYLGGKITGETELASFKLEPTVGRPLSIKGASFKSYMFRRPVGKSKLKSDTYIEKSKFRIDQPIELKEITYKGIKASKERKGKMKIPKIGIRGMGKNVIRL
jgi:hypothetical protein